MPHDVEKYANMKWPVYVAEHPNGGFRLTVLSVSDFEIFGPSREELLSEWKDAFASHLMGYLASGKVIPTPPTANLRPSNEETHSGPVTRIELDERLAPVEDLQTA